MENDNPNSTIIAHARKAQLRELLNKVELIDNKDDPGLQTVKDVKEILKELNTLEIQNDSKTHAENVDESLLDVMVLSTASNLVLKCVDAVNLSASIYESTEFATKIDEFVFEKNPDSEKDSTKLLQLLGYANDIVKNVPEFSFVYGASDNKPPEPVVKKVKAKKVPQKVAVKKQLLKVQNNDKQEEGIDVVINFLTTVLQKEHERNNNQPISYFQYIIDKSDFSKTVENMFYTSFLVRDGIARININDSGTPTIEPMRKRDLKQFRAEGGMNNQMIPSITIEQWNNFNFNQGFLESYKVPS